MRLSDVLPECLTGSRSGCGRARCIGIWCHIVHLLSQAACSNHCNDEDNCQQGTAHCTLAVSSVSYEDMIIMKLYSSGIAYVCQLSCSIVVYVGICL